MSTDRDITRIVRSWLDEGVTALPDRVLDAVLDQVPATSQRRPFWPARRFRDMNTPFKLAIVAAAVVVIAVVGFNLVPRQSGIGGPGPSPTPAPSPIVNFAGSFAPGTTYAIDDPCCVGTSRMVFTLPATGWTANDPIFMGNEVVGFGPQLVDNVFTGGCHWTGTAQTPSIGPTVDDLATALSAQAGPAGSPPAAVTVGGRPGKKVELQIPADVDVTKCDSEGDFALYGRWYTNANAISAAQPYTHSNEQHDTVYIVDVDGTRQVIDFWYPPSATAADRAQLDQIAASIRFEPRPTGPTPSPSGPTPSP